MFKTQTQLRNEAFVMTCMRLLESISGESLSSAEELVSKAISVSPLHYFVSRERAMEVYRTHLRGGAVRDGLWTEFCSDVDGVLEGRPWLGVEKAVDFVVSFKRPSRYYLSVRTGRRIIAPYLVRCLKNRIKL